MALGLFCCKAANGLPDVAQLIQVGSFQFSATTFALFDCDMTRMSTVTHDNVLMCFHDPPTN